MKKLKNEKGITLVALVVTIIILIILAAISINLVLGENGILQKTRDGRNNYQVAANEEAGVLAGGGDLIDSWINGNGGGGSPKGALEIPQNLKIGDTVNYTPSGSYVWDSEYYSSTDEGYPDNFLYTGSNTLTARRAELEAIAEESRTDAQKKDLQQWKMQKI